MAVETEPKPTQWYDTEIRALQANLEALHAKVDGIARLVASQNNTILALGQMIEALESSPMVAKMMGIAEPRESRKDRRKREREEGDEEDAG